MRIISNLSGILATVLVLIGFIPILGILNWLALLLSIVSILTGIFSKQGSSRIYIANAILILVALFRLVLGGGIF